jgi:hypothetical protein
VAAPAPVDDQPPAVRTVSASPAPPASAQAIPDPPSWEELLEPVRPRLRAHGLERTVETLIGWLDTHGQQCPSLVLDGRKQDPETLDLYSVRESLGQITLRDHTARVTRHAMAEVAKLFSPSLVEDKRLLACLAALGHDVGKIPAFRQSGLYAKPDHASISAVKLEELLQSSTFANQDRVLEAIRGHHRASTDTLTVVLQRADQRAREEELARTAGAFRVMSWPSWFDPEQWRTLVEAEINMLQRNREWAAVTWHGVVYARPDLLLAKARATMKAQRAIDLLFLADSKQDQAKAQLCAWLTEHGWLAQPIGVGYSGLPYEVLVRFPTGVSALPGHQRVYLVPIRIDRFAASAGELERRKIGLLTQIHDIRAVSIKPPQGV